MLTQSFSEHMHDIFMSIHRQWHSAQRVALYRLVLAFLLLMGGYGSLHASHNLAGQITAVYLGNNTYEITLTTYTDPAPAGVDRCSANIEIWSTGSNPRLIEIIQDIPRANGVPQISPPSECPLSNPLNGVPIYGTVKKNIYVTQYTFVGPGKFELRYYDVARRDDVINMTEPGKLAFYVETQIDFLNPILGTNNTPRLLNDPLDEACAGKLWTHNPGGYDPDGDSLVYSLRPSFQYVPTDGIEPSPTTGYVFPDNPNAFDNGPLTMDRFTGLMRWDTPVNFGTYNIAYTIEEYRNGRRLGYVVRDMAIFVMDCDNDPPVVESIDDTCVVAGTSLQIPVKAYDPNFLDSIYLELNNAGLGNNGPFSVPNAATVEGLLVDVITGNRPFVGLPTSTENNAATIDTIKATVSWETVCDNIRKQPYQIDFFAHDDDSYITAQGLVRLTANKVVTISVIPPPPEGLMATKSSRQISLSWLPTECDNALGYRVYRKIGDTGFNQDTICCEMSPKDMGYTQVAFLEGWDNTTYLDSLNDVSIFEEEVCYVVTAIYRDAFNPSIDALLESCATNQICVEVFNDKLYLTNASVLSTDPAVGELLVRWNEPDSIDAFFPRPLSYKVFRADGQEDPQTEIAELPYGGGLTEIVDTLDTETQGYNYRVDVFDASGLLVNTSEDVNVGSSIYLTTQGGNNAVTLSWTETVPWMNQSYAIHRSQAGGPFVPVDTVAGTGANTHTYIDMNLNPNEEYCYFVRSFGSYSGVPEVPQELINDSQVSCSFSVDQVPPCTPMLLVSGDCETLIHTITITKNMDICGNDTDVLRLFFSPTPDGNFAPVSQFAYNAFDLDTTLIFNFESNAAAFAGCYAITATDTLGNVSELSEPQCVEFCPDLEMGNVFTPNEDGINDYFTPVFYRDVQLVEFLVYDRWGRLMHTNNADIEVLWSGRIDGSGKPAAEGVYYYYIRYEELGLSSNIPRELKGWVTLMR